MDAGKEKESSLNLTFLKKIPFLLPATWLIRILRYEKEMRKNANKNVTDALKIGNQRIELMRKYKIIE